MVFSSILVKFCCISYYNILLFRVRCQIHTIRLILYCTSDSQTPAQADSKQNVLRKWKIKKRQRGPVSHLWIKMISSLLFHSPTYSLPSNGFLSSLVSHSSATPPLSPHSPLLYLSFSLFLYRSNDDLLPPLNYPCFFSLKVSYIKMRDNSVLRTIFFASIKFSARTTHNFSSSSNFVCDDFLHSLTKELT